jgi:hypothetical protein
VFVVAGVSAGGADSGAALVGFDFHHQIPTAATATNAKPTNRAPELARGGDEPEFDFAGLPCRMGFECWRILRGSR